ncbi:CpsD/CapB family tyrosine-protein kinase [Clostridium perfringens]|mgnify:CR=1 FL=1|uniref:CpsD/CapB family tyrosine-protein kinase n=1 Tax=Clostridium perfringens TaxID=1502 RepID=UPI000E1A0DB4|nr:CpsD/CapB family tyrosine-protein kinase [Clostridium perfringens]MDM0445816.1 CpsD/CapB family tyrosine-protein kinase [Clostridium perfringens]MDM0451595.1 CpsD/CapB family tyrosine-protein kinase [Clostridium perfringens]SUY29934.1 capsular polysaccharide biosynthesis protein [Clostridium perfringens]HBI6897031.1 CpsD/CapB family tyrosine-protein kinase [Clostridium perfringens]HBI6917922.1 CpsD/CapB family tyrosine-protein kinase [Clostridium perfringens]
MLLVDKEPKSSAAESYRGLRTSLEYSSIDKELKHIVVTSSEPGEGKSTVVCNLSSVIAQNNKKVIILDCDLRRPTIHKKFGISNSIGLTEYIVGKNDLNSIIQELNENLNIITSGRIPPNPSEVLSSKTMENLLKVLSERYDYIILDTPPLTVVTDSQILAGKCDGTILVVRAEATSKESIIKAYKELEKVRANVLGSVLNGIKGDKVYYYSEDKKLKGKS